jgi:hypothetical protein
VVQAPVGDMKLLTARDVFVRLQQARARLEKAR